MLWSPEHEFIFLHNYRTAGTSIRAALEPFSHRPERTLLRRGLRRLGLRAPAHLLPYRARSFYKHAKARDVRAQLPRHVYDRCFKFAFVRNPWDMLVSMYYYILSNSHHYFYSEVHPLDGFEPFVEWIGRRYRKLQKDFVVDERGELIVDFVGRYESLGADFRSVCRQIGVDAELPRENATSHDAFVAYYTPRARRLVEDFYREDLDFFGYTFEKAVESHA